jgi:hypothetical protein
VRQQGNRRRRLARAVAGLATTAALGCAAVAGASVTSGKYAGHYGTHADAKVSFKVKGNYLENFTAFVPALCLSGNFIFETFDVPKARISSAGKVKTTFKILSSSGQVIGERKLIASFSGRHAKGTLSGTDPGCTIATYPWTATHS